MVAGEVRNRVYVPLVVAAVFLVLAFVASLYQVRSGEQPDPVVPVIISSGDGPHREVPLTSDAAVQELLVWWCAKEGDGSCWSGADRDRLRRLIELRFESERKWSEGTWARELVCFLRQDPSSKKRRDFVRGLHEMLYPSEDEVRVALNALENTRDRELLAAMNFVLLHSMEFQFLVSSGSRFRTDAM